MELSLMLTVGGYLIGIGVVYGILKTRIDNVEKQQCFHEKRMDSLEENHTKAIQGIRDEIRGIAATLNQLVGKIDGFFQQYNKEEK